jgi:ribosomal-protein-alanine N-acetyltransferase
MVAVAPLAFGLRAMTYADLSAVANIEAAAYEFPWRRGIFRSCLDHGHHCWVLEQAGELVGYGIVAAAAGEVHVLNLCVSPRHQGHGYGTYLLRCLLDFARGLAVGRVLLEVRPSNALAHAMYARAGFRDVGRRPGYYPARHGREDAIVMVIDISAPDQETP